MRTVKNACRKAESNAAQEGGLSHRPAQARAYPMHTTLRRRTSLGLALALATSLSLASPAEARSRGFNDEYVFAATRSVNRMDVNPALKVPLFPLTVAVDLVFLPFALIAGAVS